MWKWERREEGKREEKEKEKRKKKLEGKLIAAVPDELGCVGSDTESNRGEKTYLKCVLKISEISVERCILKQERLTPEGGI